MKKQLLFAGLLIGVSLFHCRNVIAMKQYSNGVVTNEDFALFVQASQIGAVDNQRDDNNPYNQMIELIEREINSKLRTQITSYFDRTMPLHGLYNSDENMSDIKMAKLESIDFRISNCGLIWLNPTHNTHDVDFACLLENAVSAIIVDDFLPHEDCDKVKQIAQEYGLHPFDYEFNDEVPVAFSLFDTHYLYEQKTPEEYCPKAQETNAKYAEFAAKLGFDPFEKVRAFLEEKTGRSVTIAQQDDQDYTHVILRELQHSALLHADFAPFIPEYWSISNIKSELAWNIYLTDPGEGGECVVYNKLWEKEDDKYILGETYGYDEAVIAGKDCVEIPISAGRLVFFNSRNFHKVNKSQKMRLSIGGHIGLKPDGSLVMWV